MMFGMQHARRSNDADRKFARDMIEHHEMAVRMSRQFIRTGTHPMMLGMARAIIKAQEVEINRFQAFIRSGR